jgi:A/G-specific adenine glycosylase
LPWRRMPCDPYQILVSEVMLQQTQVDRVVVKFREFIREFPSVTSLARAPLHKVLAAWQGMGYNRRAKSLQQAAEAIVRDHGGNVPRTIEELDALPGIGAATASSISAFAFNQPSVFIETNIRSVFIHHFFKDADKVTDAMLLSLVEDALDRKHPFLWYSALMDYGVHLKKAFGNPSRKSAHHTAQSKFDGSDRQLRGRIIKFLVREKKAGYAALAKELSVDQQRLRRILDSLVKDGLIESPNHLFQIRDGS